MPPPSHRFCTSQFQASPSVQLRWRRPRGEGGAPDLTCRTRGGGGGRWRWRLGRPKRRKTKAVQKQQGGTHRRWQGQCVPPDPPQARLEHGGSPPGDHPRTSSDGAPGGGTQTTPLGALQGLPTGRPRRVLTGPAVVWGPRQGWGEVPAPSRSSSLRTFAAGLLRCWGHSHPW